MSRPSIQCVVALFISSSIAIGVSAVAAFAQDYNRLAQANPVERAGADAPTSVAPAEEGSAPTQSEGERREKLKRRGGEQVGDRPRGSSIVLGMHLQESDGAGVKVVKVATASPAYDAGLQDGDELLSFQGFNAKSYREWMDGIQRLTKDAPEKSIIPVVVSREGKTVALKIRVPEKKADDSRLPKALGQQITKENQTVVAPGGVAPFPQRGPINSGDDIMVAGPFGQFFGEDANNPTERAMAEIFRLGSTAQPAPPVPNPAPIGTNPSAPAGVNPPLPEGTNPTLTTGASSSAPPSNSKATQNTVAANTSVPQSGTGERIGLAGFRNTQNGMVVMVDVGGLPPGNYLVGIEDPGLIGVGDAAVETSGTPLPQPQVQPPQLTPPTNPVQDPIASPPPEPDATPRPAQPRGNQPVPQSNLQQPRQIPRTVLAQVVDRTATGIATPAPATAQPTNAAPAGPVLDNRSRPQQPVLPPAASAGGVSPTMNQIGTLTVDDSGTGRMQQEVEGVQVQGVVGQAIVIWSQGAGQQQTLPANLDPAADPTTGEAAQQSLAQGSQNVAQPQLGAAVPRQGTSPNGALNDSPVPVAAGLIRLVSDRRPGATGLDATGVEPQVTPADGQPVNTPAGVNPVR